MRNKILILSLLILIFGLANGYLYYQKQAQYHLDFDATLFQIDNPSTLYSIKIGTINLSLDKNNIWKLNQKYDVEPTMLYRFFQFFKFVQIKKEDSGREFVDSVAVTFNDNETFYVASDEAKTKTFFLVGEKTYEVGIPGITYYLGEIFEWVEDHWRDRLLCNLSLEDIHSIIIETENTEKVKITSKNKGFHVAGIDRLDTLALRKYLKQFENLRANEFVSRGRIPFVDSTYLHTKPHTYVNVHAQNTRESSQFKIYPKSKNANYYLISKWDRKEGKDHLFVMEAEKMEALLVEKAHFELTD